MRKIEKIKSIKERLANIYNELDEVDFDNSNQSSHAIQILSNMMQAAYYFDKLIKELEMEGNSGSKQI